MATAGIKEAPYVDKFDISQYQEFDRDGELVIYSDSLSNLTETTTVDPAELATRSTTTTITADTTTTTPLYPDDFVYNFSTLPPLPPLCECQESWTDSACLDEEQKGCTNCNDNPLGSWCYTTDVNCPEVELNEAGKSEGWFYCNANADAITESTCCHQHSRYVTMENMCPSGGSVMIDANGDCECTQLQECPPSCTAVDAALLSKLEMQLLEQAVDQCVWPHNRTDCAFQIVQEFSGASHWCLDCLFSLNVQKYLQKEEYNASLPADLLSNCTMLPITQFGEGWAELVMKKKNGAASLAPNMQTALVSVLMCVFFARRWRS